MTIKINSQKKLNYFGIIVLPLLIITYLVFEHFTFGIRGDHWLLVIIVAVCFYSSLYTRKLITGLAIVILYWIIYDSMKAWPNWAFGQVDIVHLYNLEKSIFGIHVGDIILTPNEYLLMKANSATDLLAGFFYLSWIPLPLLFAFYLYFTNKNLFLRFSMAFFIVNCIGFIIYYVHPAAPPWYIAEHGTTLDVTTKSYAAGLLRIDHFLGNNLFEGVYSKGSNVFAALPSLHSSYPLIGFVYACNLRGKFFKIVFGTVMCGIWFSAVYLSHHYVIDVLTGIGCGLLGIFILEKILLQLKSYRGFFDRYLNYISG